VCRLLGVATREPRSPRETLIDAPRSLHAVSLRGAKAPHRDGIGWAWRDAQGRMRLHRWGAQALAGHDLLPGDPPPPTSLLLAHARKGSPGYASLRGAVHAQPLAHDGLILAHNGTVHDVDALGEGGGTDSQVLLRWLARAWSPRTHDRLVQALAELLALVRDFTALNLLLTEGTTLWALCLYTQDPDYYTLHWRQGDGEVVVASQPVDDQPGWAPLATGTLLRVGPDLAVSTEGLVPPA